MREEVIVEVVCVIFLKTWVQVASIIVSWINTNLSLSVVFYITHFLYRVLTFFPYFVRFIILRVILHIYIFYFIFV